MKKLNKRRVKMLVGIIVGVLLIVGTCIGSIINSVDYEKAENDIAIIEKARIESRELYEVSLNMGKTIWLDCSYDENKFYYEVDEAKKCYKELQKVDLEEIEKYCEHTNRDYNEILNKYNQTFRTPKYIEYAFEELEKSEINGLIAFGEISGLLEEDEVPADKLELLRKYDALTGYVEVE